MYAKEIAQKIRNEIKALGYTAKKVSVRCNSCGYSDSIRITIKDIAIPEKAIVEIANKYESVRYDEYTGEILEGGNLYIFVEYDYDTVKNAYEPYLEKAEEVFNTTGEKTVKVMEKNGKELWYYGGCYGDGRGGQCFEFENDKFGENIPARGKYEVARAMAFFDAQN